MNILDKARTLESRIARTLSRAAEDVVGSSARRNRSRSRTPSSTSSSVRSSRAVEVRGSSRSIACSVSVLAPSRDATRAFRGAVRRGAVAARSCPRSAAIGRMRRERRSELDVVFRRPHSQKLDDPQFHVAFDRVSLRSLPLRRRSHRNPCASKSRCCAAQPNAVPTRSRSLRSISGGASRSRDNGTGCSEPTMSSSSKDPPAGTRPFPAATRTSPSIVFRRSSAARRLERSRNRHRPRRPNRAVPPGTRGVRLRRGRDRARRSAAAGVDEELLRDENPTPGPGTAAATYDDRRGARSRTPRISWTKNFSCDLRCTLVPRL